MSWGEAHLKRFEDYAYILDYLPRGKMGSFRADPLVQIIGESYFTLLEAMPREGSAVSSRERVYVGNEAIRDKISHIIGRIEYNNLTVFARNELPIVVEVIVIKNEKRYIQFFNTAQAVTPRMHSLELIPGIGKKYTRTILDVRETGLFNSYKDVKEKTDIPDPAKLIVKRILEELSQPSRYRLFIRPP